MTAVARPTEVVWTLGDGTAVTCAGPGTPYTTQADARRTSPDCGHTYRAASVGRPHQTYGVVATVHWAVTWTGGGDSGTFPDLTTTSNAGFRVVESQALNK
ncbi:hypothetical protein [Streptomyces sp. NPDC102360]|uniref:hypothetical protein n=1 Tax=Streptomyces sp. NPDC102360 TaxID=3366160 RepID=UPI00381283CD